jgi:hypothetical protein
MMIPVEPPTGSLFWCFFGMVFMITFTARVAVTVLPSSAVGEGEDLMVPEELEESKFYRFV